MIALFASTGSVAALGLLTIAATQLQVIPYLDEGSDQIIQPAPVNSRANVIRVTKTDQVVSRTGDPIWTVELVVNGEARDRVDALIGRANRQNLNRHTSGNKSPLPIGRYRIDRSGIEMGPFSDPEVGRGYWIPITPLFSTNRSFLGLHQDPSWGKANGESGTSGCIGVYSVDDTKKIVRWIREYNVNSILVES